MEPDPEKRSAGSVPSDSDPEYATNDSFGDIDKQRLMLNIDIRVVGPICILYLLAFLDRVNISNAVIFGLQSELSLTGVQYNTALTIFFVPYIVAEIPANVIMKRLKPHVWLSSCMFAFGTITLCQGFVRNWGGLMTTRFLLGVFEAGMFPGCFYLLSMYYRRAEAQKRYSFFFSSTSLAGAFGGLLASAIGKMEGVAGHKGWRWIFILEGLLTIVLSVMAFFCIVDFPEEARFLTDREKAYVKVRLKADVGDSLHHKKVTFRDVLSCFKDYKMFVGGLMYFGLIIPAYSFAYFAPTIIRGYTTSPIQTQLRSVPPWAAAFIFSMLVAWASDRLKHRFLFAIGTILIAFAGFITLVSLKGNKDAQYAMLFLVACGCYSAMPIVVCWFNTNLGGHTRRSVGTAWQIAFGNIGGIIATYSFLKEDAPRYTKGYSICLGGVALAGLSCIVYWVGVKLENREREKKWAWGEMVESGEGDLAIGYRYVT